MKFQNIAKIYGLDLPAKVRVSHDGQTFMLTDWNEALVIDREGNLLDMKANPWAKTYGKDFTPEEKALQSNYKTLQ